MDLSTTASHWFALEPRPVNENMTYDLPVGNASDTRLQATNGTAEEKEEYMCRLFRFVFLAIICSLVCVLGLVGNTLSFLVYHRDGSSPVASFLLQSIAVADNCFLLLWMIHYSIRELITFLDYSTWYIKLLRMWTFPVLYMAQMQTIWLTVVIAMNRFMAVCLPYRAPHLCNIYNVYKEVTVVTLFSLLYNIPRFFELTAVNNGTYNEIERTDLGKDSTYKHIYTDILYYCFTFFLPLLTLAFVNTRVICAFRAAKRRKQRMMSRGRADNDHNITLVMIVVVVVFMLCQAPARIVQMVWSYEFNHCHELQFYFIHVSNSLEVLNSSVNFLIYIIFRKRFTEILVKNFCAGPIVRRHYYSTRSLTTEGLALTEYGKTTSFKNTNSLKSNRELPAAALSVRKAGGHDEEHYARYASLHVTEEREEAVCNGHERIELVEVNRQAALSPPGSSHAENDAEVAPLTS